MFSWRYVSNTVLTDRGLDRACREAFRGTDTDDFVAKLVARLAAMGIRRGAYRRAERIYSTQHHGPTVAITALVSSGSDGEKFRRIRFDEKLEIVTDEERKRPLPDLGFKQVLSPKAEVETLSDLERVQSQDPRRLMGDYKDGFPD